MQKLKDMGYDGVELAGLYSYTPAQIRQMLDRGGDSRDFRSCSYAELLADPEGTIAAYKEIGCQYIAFPYLTEDVRHGTPAFAETLEHMRHICEVAKIHGYADAVS